MRLEKMGLVNSVLGESTAVRGGRGEKIYNITEKGINLNIIKN